MSAINALCALVGGIVIIVLLVALAVAFWAAVAYLVAWLLGVALTFYQAVGIGFLVRLVLFMAGR